MPIGCLVLHGFTSCSDSVNRVPARLMHHGLPYRMPVLRGHGTQPEDLFGVTWHDWYADADAAFRDLRREVDHVIVIGLSMGGLVALHLAAAHQREVAAVVALAPAMRFFNRYAPYAAYAAPVKPMWGDPNRDMGVGWGDPELGRQHGNYRQFPISAFASLYRYAQVVERQLPRITAPALLLHSRVDQTIPGAASEAVYRQISSVDKQLLWFERSGHEMLRDIEASAVLDHVEHFVLRQVARVQNPALAIKE